VQGGEPLSASKVENKLLHGSGSNHKEGNNTSMPEFRRSRSTPRGKFFGLS
jgi:kinesin family protein C2/C3